MGAEGGWGKKKQEETVWRTKKVTQTQLPEKKIQGKNGLKIWEEEIKNNKTRTKKQKTKRTKMHVEIRIN